MDLIQLLECRNLGLITRKIFHCLPLHDILVCTQVSKVWRSIIQEQVLWQESQEKTERKWLNGKFKVTKLDVEKHLGEDGASCELDQTVCWSSYIFLFPSKVKENSIQLMIVYCGTNFVCKVEMPECEGNKWDIMEVLVHGREDFVLLGKAMEVLGMVPVFGESGAMTKLNSP